MVTKTLVPAALLLLLLAGCGGAEVKPASFNLPEEATHELRELFRTDGPAEGAFFTNIGAIQVMRDGNLIVQNSRATQLFELSPAGALVNVIGREGRGPGEFQQIFDIYLLGNDSLHVVEPNRAHHQVLVKTEDGHWEQHRERFFIWNNPESPSELKPTKVITGPNGTFFGIFPIWATQSDTLEDHNNFYVARVNHNLVQMAQMAQMAQMGRVRRVEDIAVPRTPSSFRGFYHYNPVRDEVIYITNTSNEIFLIDSAGTERVGGNLPFDRFPARKDSALQAMTRLWIEYYGSVSAEFREAFEQALLDHEPYYWLVVYDQQTGRLWLNLARSDGGPNWVISNLEGEVLGSFYGPRFKDSLTNSVVVARGNRIYGAIVDSNGVDYMTGFELVEIGELKAKTATNIN